MPGKKILLGVGIAGFITLVRHNDAFLLLLVPVLWIGAAAIFADGTKNLRG